MSDLLYYVGKVLPSDQRVQLLNIKIKYSTDKYYYVDKLETPGARIRISKEQASSGRFSICDTKAAALTFWHLRCETLVRNAKARVDETALELAQATALQRAYNV